MVDSLFPGSEPSTLEPSYISDENNWEQMQCHRFLDSSQTHLLSRILWVPDWQIIPTKFRRQWGTYCLLRRKLATIKNPDP